MNEWMNKYLDDGEHGLHFIFEYLEAAGQFAFDLIQGVFSVGAGRGWPAGGGGGGAVRRVAPDGPTPKRSHTFRHFDAVFGLHVDGQQPRE